MGNTTAGGKRAARTVRKLYGREFYQRIGALGGAASWGHKGFAANRDLASAAGRVGGLTSRRGKKRTPVQEKLYQQCLKRLEAVKAEAEARRIA